MKYSDIEPYYPEHMDEWEWPNFYYGASWEDYYVLIGRNRDSDALENSNYETAMAMLKEIPEPEDWPFTDENDDPVDMWLDTRAGHWALGWVETIYIHKNAYDHLRKGDEIVCALANYPVLDEEDFSERETDDANQCWQFSYNDRSRIEYIRKHRSQFNFGSWAELRAVVRGDYFNGYASDLLH